MSFATPNPRFRRVARVLIFAALLGAVALHLVATRRQSRALELLRVENLLLEQEARLLRQHLEAERLQSAALARRLQAAEATAPTEHGTPSAPTDPAGRASP